MCFRRTAIPAVLALALLAAPGGAADPDKDNDKDGKRWLEEVAPLLLREEQKTYQKLKDKAEREEFQKIFWARRNPLGPAVSANPFRQEYETFRAEADKRFTVMGKPGSSTECARVLYLLGQPDSLRQAEMSGSEGWKLGRVPEIWTYKSRPGFEFSSGDVKGQMTLGFDERCQLPSEAKPFLEQLERMAQTKVRHEAIAYRIEGGRLVKLADLLPKATAVQALLEAPRQDFPLTAEPKVLMKAPAGTYVGGMVRGQATGLTLQDEAGKKRVALAVTAQALDEGGKIVATAPDQETAAEVGADGSFLGSYGLTLKPGKYTVRVGVLDIKGNKGAVASAPLEVPDFESSGFKVAELMILSDVQEGPPPDAKDPFAAFHLGSARVVPRYGNVFAPSDTLQALAFVYNAEPDPATGKPSVACRFNIQKDGKTISSTDQDQVFDTAVATPGIGPVPLTNFAPGRYTVQLKVVDKVAKKEAIKEAAFEVKAP